MAQDFSLQTDPSGYLRALVAIAMGQEFEPCPRPFHSMSKTQNEREIFDKRIGQFVYFF